jgi:hypothetical protein
MNPKPIFHPEPHSTFERQLSVVLVSWNTREVLRRCLVSLFEHAGMGLDVIVVDNASGDETVAMLQSEFSSVRVIANEENVGFARACNQGMRASESRYILLLNSDTYVVDDSIRRLVATLDARTEISMLGCQIRTPNDRVQHTANRALGIFRGLFEDLWLYRFVSPKVWKRMLLGGYWENDEEAEVDWLAGVFMLLRRSMFLEDGGFCEDFFMYGEDSEWCMRLRKKGRRILFTPGGVVYHIGAVSSDRRWTARQRLRLCYLGDIRAYSKVNGPVLGIIYTTTRLLGSLVRTAVYSVASLLSRSEYLVQQRRHYGWRSQFYLEGWLTVAALRR